LSTYKLDKAVSAKDSESLDKKIESLVREKEEIERVSQSAFVDLVTKEDLEKLNFSDDLSKLKAIQRERILEDLSFLLNEKIKEIEHKDQVLSELTIALDTKVKQLELSNSQLQEEKIHAEELNESLRTTLKKLSDAEMQLKIERDWLADQVEKKSLEVIKTIEQLIQAESAKSTSS
jgi:hypothetical protein